MIRPEIVSAAGRSLLDTIEEGTRRGLAPPDVTTVWRLASAGPTVDELLAVARITALAVADCAGGVFDIKKDKTAAGKRRIPIHPDLRAIVRRRTKDKAPTDFLFEDVGTRRTDGARSDALGKRFATLRRRLGIDEREAGQRQSNVDFHSWRRWFVTKAEQAGQLEHIIQAVIGHKRPSLALATYSGGPSVGDQMAGCVRAVKLPKGVKAPR